MSACPSSNPALPLVGVFFCDIFTLRIVPSKTCFTGMLFIAVSYTLDHRVHPLVQIGPPARLATRTERGRGPSTQATGHLSTPYDIEPHVSIKVVLSAPTPLRLKMTASMRKRRKSPSFAPFMPVLKSQQGFKQFFTPTPLPLKMTTSVKKVRKSPSFAPSMPVLKI